KLELGKQRVQRRESLAIAVSLDQLLGAGDLDLDWNGCASQSLFSLRGERRERVRGPEPNQRLPLGGGVLLLAQQVGQRDQRLGAWIAPPRRRRQIGERRDRRNGSLHIPVATKHSRQAQPRVAVKLRGASYRREALSGSVPLMEFLISDPSVDQTAIAQDGIVAGEGGHLLGRWRVSFGAQRAQRAKVADWKRIALTLEQLARAREPASVELRLCCGWRAAVEVRREIAGVEAPAERHRRSRRLRNRERRVFDAHETRRRLDLFRIRGRAELSLGRRVLHLRLGSRVRLLFGGGAAAWPLATRRGVGGCGDQHETNDQQHAAHP